MAVIVEDEEYLTAKEVAARYRLSADSVRQWIRGGVLCRGRRLKLYAVRAGYVYRIPRASLEEFLSELNPGEVPARPSPSKEASDAERDCERLRARLSPKVRKGARP